MSVDIEKNMERIETREKYLNGQLCLLLNQFSKKQQELQQVETNYRNASGNSVHPHSIPMMEMIQSNYVRCTLIDQLLLANWFDSVVVSDAIVGWIIDDPANLFVIRMGLVGVEERTKKLDQLNEEIQRVKYELDERTSNMSDGSKFSFSSSKRFIFSSSFSYFAFFKKEVDVFLEDCFLLSWDFENILKNQLDVCLFFFSDLLIIFFDFFEIDYA